MNALARLIADFGVGTVLCAALVLILLRGRILFEYPRRQERHQEKQDSQMRDS
jgi:hypothetical protein